MRIESDEEMNKIRRRSNILLVIIAACLLITGLSSFADASRPLRYYTDSGNTALTYYTNASGDGNKSYWGINTDNPLCDLDINGTVCLNSSGVYFNGVNISSSGDGNNYPTALQVTQTGSNYQVNLSRSGLSTLSANFTVSSSGGGGAGINSGPNYPLRRNATNSSLAENFTVVCDYPSGYALGALTNDSICFQTLLPATAAATYYPLSNPSGYTSNTGTVTSVSFTTNGSSAIVVSGGPITTSGTLNIQVQNATTTQDGLMTATQATSLSLKALAGNCVGSNSTHVNVTMNGTTSGPQCVAVALNPGGGSGGGNTTQEVRDAINNSAVNISGNAFNAYNLGGLSAASYYLASNPAGYISSFTEVDPVFTALWSAIYQNSSILKNRTDSMNASIQSIGNWTLDKTSYSTTAVGDGRWGNQSFNVTCSAGTYPQSFAFNKDGTQNSTTCVSASSGGGNTTAEIRNAIEGSDVNITGNAGGLTVAAGYSFNDSGLYLDGYRIPYRVTLMASSAADTNSPAAEQLFLGAMMAQVANLTGYTQVRTGWTRGTTTGAAAYNGYSKYIDLGSCTTITPSSWSNLSSTNENVDLTSQNRSQVTAWSDMPSAAATEVCVALATRGGDGALDPNVRQGWVEFR